MIDYLRKYAWAHLPARIPYRSCLREAALWGGGLILLSWGFHAWGKFERETFLVLATIGGAIAILLPIPRVGEQVYLALLRVFAVFGFVVGRVGLTLMFYLAVTPLGLLLRALGKDPLLLRQDAPPSWSATNPGPEPRRYYRLF